MKQQLDDARRIMREIRQVVGGLAVIGSFAALGWGMTWVTSALML